jgi:tetratricopeptide (TPR) repeat protein
MKNGPQPGQIITFYSYKGGTGRTMALANMACLLAQEQYGAKGVLMVDWDLEAPGLHRFFDNKLSPPAQGGSGGAGAVDAAPGLIDLFMGLRDSLQQFDPDQGEPSEEDLNGLIDRVNIGDYVLATEVPSLYLLKAGKFDGRYAERVNTFDWNRLFGLGPDLFRVLAEKFLDQFQYVLIDSRTGLNDTSGICTTLMPEKLVVVFTPNRQSLIGLDELVKRAVAYRRESDDIRPLTVFPLASRIEASEPELKKIWRKGREEDHGLRGYQEQFEAMFSEVYELSECDLEEYFNDVQIQHSPRYSYGENIAVLVEQSGDRLSLTRSYEKFTDSVVRRPCPWEIDEDPGQQLVQAKQARSAERIYGGFSEEEQQAARKILTLLVTVTEDPDDGEASLARLKLNRLRPSEQKVAHKLIDGGLAVSTGTSTDRNIEIKLADASIVENWTRLRDWIDADREFLAWRAQLSGLVQRWERLESDKLLLHDPFMEEALDWRKERARDLTEDQIQYIAQSEKSKKEIKAAKYRRRKRRRLVYASILALGVGISMIGTYSLYRIQTGAELTRARLQEAVSLGDGAAQAGKYEAAENYYHQAKSISQDLQDSETEAGLYDKLGTIYTGMKNYGQAIESYSSAVEIYSRSDMLNKEAAALHKIGGIYTQTGEFNNAENTYQRVMVLAEKTGSREEEALALEGLGKVSRKRGSAGEALEYFQKALNVYAEMGDKSRQAAVNVDIGSTLSNHGEKQSALSSYLKAETLYREINDNEGLAAALRNIGNLFKEMGDEKKALIYFQKSAEIAEQKTEARQNSSNN